MRLEATIILAGYFWIGEVIGDLIEVSHPLCPLDSATYRCNVSQGFITWDWTTSSGIALPRFSLISSGHPSGTVIERTVGATRVTYNVTESSPSSFTTVATVNNPVNLNGTMITCGGQALTISIIIMATIMEPLNVNGTTTTCNGETLTINIAQIDLRPKFLTVTRNGSEVNLYPNIQGDVNRVDYQLSNGSRMVVTQPISVIALENITFFHCQENLTFTMNAACLLEDNDEGLNYTLFSNATWEISRICGNIQVTCNNGDWSEDISCPQLTTATYSIETNTMITKNRNSAITNEDKSNTSTGKAEDSNICPSCSSAVLTAIISSVIGTFLLTFVLGNSVGLLCGIKYARGNHSKNKSKKKVVMSAGNKNLSKGPLYEEVEVQKDVELQPNISYETVHKIAS